MDCVSFLAVRCCPDPEECGFVLLPNAPHGEDPGRSQPSCCCRLWHQTRAEHGGCRGRSTGKCRVPAAASTASKETPRGLQIWEDSRRRIFLHSELFISSKWLGLASPVAMCVGDANAAISLAAACLACCSLLLDLSLLWFLLEAR